jgi:hypothetical protein
VILTRKCALRGDFGDFNGISATYIINTGVLLHTIKNKDFFLQRSFYSEGMKL